MLQVWYRRGEHINGILIWVRDHCLEVGFRLELNWVLRSYFMSIIILECSNQTTEAAVCYW